MWITCLPAQLQYNMFHSVTLQDLLYYLIRQPAKRGLKEQKIIWSLRGCCHIRVENAQFRDLDWYRGQFGRF